MGNSFSAGLEFGREYQAIINYGLGVLYQSTATLSGTKGDIGLIPVYAFVDYPLTGNNEIPVLLSLRLGYGFLQTKSDISSLDNGLYHAIGLTGDISRKFQIKLLYSNNYGKVLLDGNEYSLRNGNMSIAVNFRF